MRQPGAAGSTYDTNMSEVDFLVGQTVEELRYPANGLRIVFDSGGPRPVKWCARLTAPSSLDVYAAASIAITSSASSTGSASAFAIDSALM